MATRDFVRGAGCTLALAGSLVAGGAPAPAASTASATGRHATARPAVPAANFFVEWRIRPADSAGAGQAQVFTSRSATTGGSGFGAGAVVVGTAQGAGAGESGTASSGLRVANGQEGWLKFDRPETRTVYDLSWLFRGSGGDTQPGMEPPNKTTSGGAASHEVAVHHVEGLRVVPRWTRGDSLPLELAVVRDAKQPDERDLELRTTVQVSLGEWTGVARLGTGDDELQVRVTWR